MAACTQDELAEQGNTLPDGEYPLQIGNITITTDEQPWTRIAENEDGMGSHWTDGDKIGVRIGDNEETGVYIIKVDDAGNVTVKPDKPVYWKSTQTADVTAWYPAERSSVSLDLQFLDGLTYVLRGTGTGSYQSPVTLKFEHKLAKVRVVAKGTAQVRNMSIWNVPTSCAIEEGIITEQLPIRSSIQMLSVKREGIGTCWEANVGPGVEIKSFNIENTETVSQIYDLTSPVITQAGALHTITWTVNNAGTTTIDLSTEDYIINDDRTYYFSGTGSHAIKVTNGNPEIYLEDAQISVAGGPAIDIQGGSPTIHVRGENTVQCTGSTPSTAGAGVYVAQGSSVTIEGRDRNDVLIAQAGNNGAGIGGYGTDAQDCGNITIRNVTVHAYAVEYSIDYPGIGGHESCGTIAIDNATVYARGIGYSYSGYPAIGAESPVPVITISASEIHAFRGSSYADWIGLYGDMNGYTGGAIQGTITNSTVYCYTGDTLDKTVTYDASGNWAEQ